MQNRITNVLGALFRKSADAGENTSDRNLNSVGAPGRRRFATLAPSIKEVAEHLTRIDRFNEVKKVRELYTKMKSDNSRFGALFLYGDDNDGADDFSDRLRLLAHENKNDDKDDWPIAEDIFSTLSYRDPFPIQDWESELGRTLRNQCGTECRTEGDIFNYIAESNRLCILGFKIPRAESKHNKTDIAGHVDRLLTLSQNIEADTDSDARFLCIYRFEAETERVRLEELEACKPLFKRPLTFPHEKIDIWSEVSLDHIDEWRSVMYHRIITRLGPRGDEAVIQAIADLKAQNSDAIQLGLAIDTIVNHLKAMQLTGDPA